MKKNISQNYNKFISDIVKSTLCLIISLVLIFIFKNKNSIFNSIILILLNLSTIFFALRITYLFFKDSLQGIINLNPSLFTLSFLSVIFLGRLSYRDIYFTTALSLISNKILSFDKKRSMNEFFKKVDVKFHILKIPDVNFHILKIPDVSNLSENELEGKYIAQEKVINIFIILFFLMIRFTEDINFTFKMLFRFQNQNIPLFFKFICKGLDRIIVSLIFLLLFEKSFNIKENLKKIFF